ncbi:GNAT family N-acetyltransferase/peptidase C39 family protein [Aliidiomarina quisquiliarum]|uniref:GNAT family N-acetyltransferase/peptidase C39 family protein n=1 Tax=Aliidiomarina quisquiliarum TaxID=2938947 RepID=UPI00208F0B42|nr:GNAT family N-acetyltransferase/peptidase C39 family protein [Aliidiomarina quisquiliarum]MCO4320055.1 GNAT family N-acetyltransferase/peptidase C39 family protein [Aliidiomarina quisquiliarum]
MTTIRRIVPAHKDHLVALQSINQRGAPYDTISRRSFRRFIQHEQAELFALEVAEEASWLCVGYAILLYRKATKLARLYSLAVDPDWQRQGLGSELLAYAENQAREAHALFLRLEVPAADNDGLAFFRQRGYVQLGLKTAYFDDKSDALVLQKQLHFFNSSQVPRLVPYVAQSTDFTCGPACLLMALAYFKLPLRHPDFEELEIWREATTIFMTSGHGGCGPHGLARAAIKRGLKVELWVSQAGPVMLDSVRNTEKRSVMERIQQADIETLKKAKVPVHTGDYDLDKLRADLAAGKLVLTLISTYQFDQMKAPHWVLVTAADEEFVYINDPDDDLLPWQTESERQYLPVPTATFLRAFGYGSNRLRTAVVLSI